TRCPSSGPASVRAGSRLTVSPGCNRPRLVRSMVSGTTSARKMWPSSWTRVRQAPLTATLAPTSARAVIDGASMAMRPSPWSVTRPRVLTIPVNIAADHQIIAKPRDLDIVQPEGVRQLSHARPGDRRGGFLTADHDGCQEGDHGVDQACIEEGAVDFGAALDEQAQDVPAAELLEQLIEVDALAWARRAPAQHLGARRLQRGHSRGRRAGGGRHQRRRLAALPGQHRRRRRDPEGRVDDHAQGLAGRPGEPVRQLWIVLDDGAGADQDGVMELAQPVSLGAGPLAGDPARLPAGGRDPAIEADRELDGDEGPAGDAVLDVEAVEPACGGLFDADRHLDALGTQPGEPGASLS